MFAQTNPVVKSPFSPRMIPSEGPALFEFDLQMLEAVEPPTDEECEAFERDYQTRAQRPLEIARLRDARRYALEQFIARRRLQA